MQENLNRILLDNIRLSICFSVRGMQPGKCLSLYENFEKIIVKIDGSIKVTKSFNLQLLKTIHRLATIY